MISGTTEVIEIELKVVQGKSKREMGKWDGSRMSLRIEATGE